MSERESGRDLHVRRNLLAGLLTMLPLWLTFVVFEFVLGQLSKISAPWVNAAFGVASARLPFFARFIDVGWLRFVVALAATLIGLYLLGSLAHRMVGRRLLGAIDRLIESVPVVQTIYGGTKRLLAALQTKPEGAQRVVLVDFPHAKMKAIGFVTRTMRDEDGGELAAVYVPTTPNPTSGYLEIVPIDQLIPTDWTVDQAMAFIISGGAVAPDQVPLPGRASQVSEPVVPPTPPPATGAA